MADICEISSPVMTPKIQRQTARQPSHLLIQTAINKTLVKRRTLDLDAVEARTPIKQVRMQARRESSKIESILNKQTLNSAQGFEFGAAPDFFQSNN